LLAKSNGYYQPIPQQYMRIATVFYVEKCSTYLYLIRNGDKTGAAMYYSYYDWVSFSTSGNCGDVDYVFTLSSFKTDSSK